MSIIQRGAQWWFQKRIQGKLHRHALKVPVKGAAEKELAARRANEIELKIRSEGFGYDKPPAPTFKEWVAKYTATYLPLKGERTQARDLDTLRLHALPYFGAKRLDKITKSDCVAYLNTRRAAFHADPRRKSPTGISEATVQRERALIAAVFQRALEDELITVNPWRGIKRIRTGPRDRVLQADDQAKLLAELDPTWQRFVRFLLCTGLRLDEVLSADLKKLDFEKHEIAVLGKGRQWRIVPLQPVAVAIAQAQLADGGWWRQPRTSVRDILASAARRAGIPRISPHCLRHSFGSRWIIDGGNISVLAKILGHSSVTTTERNYIHLLREDLSKEMAKRDLGVRA
jgi:integrase